MYKYFKNLSLVLCLIWSSFQAGVSAEMIASVKEGVSEVLAKYRRKVISDIHYKINLSIPSSPADRISAHEIVEFKLNDNSQDLQFDFKEKTSLIIAVKVNGMAHNIIHQSEHIIIKKSALKKGKNAVEFTFFAGDSSLNRKPEFLYTLFVPDRARTAFPIFDQPDLKAVYDLTLEIPSDWTAISSSPVKMEKMINAKRKSYQFETSQLMSSYLFSFVAGKFETVTRTILGRQMTMLHREMDNEKVERNLDAIFDLHMNSLEWLEDYTAIKYPFKKFDFALIPSHQYGGMEHVGAVQYKAATLFLDEDPSDAQLLGRANLIAHETAHMWFGNLVTMQWFNDVWTKEVYANFMAAKIVNPSFPDIDHDLNFLRLSPGAYSVDRTEGANPIRQPLPNLNEAGNLYGGIIYNKAPIMMKQLETLIGKDNFRDGIREYLKNAAYKNATWDDLIALFDKRSDENIVKWSKVWVNSPRRPKFKLKVKEAGKTWELVQYDPLNLNRKWSQGFSYSLLSDLKTEHNIAFSISDKHNPILTTDKVIFNSNGKGYGLFPVKLATARDIWSQLSDLQKGSLLINLNEQMLSNNKHVRPFDYIQFLTKTMREENNQLLLNLTIGQMTKIYRTLLSPQHQTHMTIKLEKQLWELMMTRNMKPAQRKMFFKAFQNFAMTEDGLNKLQELWNDSLKVEGLKISENDKISLALNLALKKPAAADMFYAEQLLKIKNVNGKRKFIFIKRALSNDPEIRDEFFNSLKDVKNRANERWVADALMLLHHPLRRAHSEKYILASLDLMEEIQKTGDIFFPARWISASLRNHNTASAVNIIRRFFKNRPNYNYQLKLKILQAADSIFRANVILSKTNLRASDMRETNLPISNLREPK